ncbi:MAG: GreA/GreB family elongation factor [Ruthenibacterium sp.]
MGGALLGHRVGDVVEILLPNGNVSHYKVLEIGRADI